jgi:hypothetical protein
VPAGHAPDGVFAAHLPVPFTTSTPPSICPEGVGNRLRMLMPAPNRPLVGHTARVPRDRLDDRRPATWTGATARDRPAFAISAIFAGTRRSVRSAGRFRRDAASPLASCAAGQRMNPGSGW